MKKLYLEHSQFNHQLHRRDVMRFIFLKNAFVVIKNGVLRNWPKVKIFFRELLLLIEIRIQILKIFWQNHYWPKIKSNWSKAVTTIKGWVQLVKLKIKAVSLAGTMRLKRWIQLAKQKVEKFYRKVKISAKRWMRKAASKVAAFSRRARVLLKWTRKVTKYLEQKAKHAWNGVSKKTSQLFQKIGSDVKLHPNLWLGGVHIALTISLFSVAYVTKNWKLFHFGLLSLLTTPLFFINHHNKWSDIGDFVSKERNWVWLGLSVTLLLLSYGHQWGLRPIVISAISATCAIITIANWWRNIGKGIGEGTDILWTNFKKPFQGEHRLSVTLFFGLFLTFVVYNFLFMGQSHLTGKALDTAQSLAVVMVVLLLSALGFLILEIHQKME